MGTNGKGSARAGGKSVANSGAVLPADIVAATDSASRLGDFVDLRADLLAARNASPGTASETRVNAYVTDELRSIAGAADRALELTTKFSKVPGAEAVIRHLKATGKAAKAALDGVRTRMSKFRSDAEARTFASRTASSAARARTEFNRWWAKVTRR